jgi:hypothetical protein
LGSVGQRTRSRAVGTVRLGSAAQCTLAMRASGRLLVGRAAHPVACGRHCVPGFSGAVHPSYARQSWTPLVRSGSISHRARSALGRRPWLSREHLGHSGRWRRYSWLRRPAHPSRADQCRTGALVQPPRSAASFSRAGYPRYAHRCRAPSAQLRSPFQPSGSVPHALPGVHMTENFVVREAS